MSEQPQSGGARPRPEKPPLTTAEAQAIAESIVGPVDWHGAEGWCPCPGAELHTKPTSGLDLHVVVETLGDGTRPGAYCFHTSCLAVREDVSFQIRSALGKRQPSGDGRSVPARLAVKRPEPKFEPEKLARLAGKRPEVDAAWYAARSPIPVAGRTPAEVLHLLYQPGEKVVVFDVFESQGQALWTPGDRLNPTELDGFRKGAPCGVWFLNNPVDGQYVDTGKKHPDGRPKMSRRSYLSVTAFRYVLVESDSANPALWLAALAQLPLRIACITTSGGKSIHALVRVDAGSKAEFDELVKKMKPSLITLGADRAAMSAVRLTRLPMCERLGTTDKDGNYIAYPAPRMQELLYLNPDPAEVPICEIEPT